MSIKFTQTREDNKKNRQNVNLFVTIFWKNLCPQSARTFG